MKHEVVLREGPAEVESDSGGTGEDVGDEAFGGKRTLDHCCTSIAVRALGAGLWPDWLWSWFRVLFQPGLELAVAFEDELQSLGNNMVEVVGAEELGVALHRLSKGFLDAHVVPALGDQGFRWL